MIATFGVPGFFTPRVPPAPLWPPGSPQSQSYYDTAPLKKTLERLVDFDRINDLKTRLSVGAVGVASGNFRYFDNFEFKKLGKKIGPEHIMASGALPPGFPVRSRSTASITGTAASPPTRRSTMCWTRRPAAIS